MLTDVTGTADLPHKVLSVSVYQEQVGVTKPGRAEESTGDWNSKWDSTPNLCDCGQIPSPLRPVCPEACGVKAGSDAP